MNASLTIATEAADWFIAFHTPEGLSVESNKWGDAAYITGLADGYRLCVLATDTGANLFLQDANGVQYAQVRIDAPGKLVANIIAANVAAFAAGVEDGIYS